MKVGKRCKARDHGTQCRRNATRRGWCDKHYFRWRYKGDTRTVREIKSIAARAKFKAEFERLAAAAGIQTSDPIFGKKESE